MVTFNENLRYSQALQTGRQQKKIMDEVLKQSNLSSDWERLDFEKIVAKLK
jgi:hypothetical protein